jgi:hypothetical protein
LALSLDDRLRAETSRGAGEPATPNIGSASGLGMRVLPCGRAATLRIGRGDGMHAAQPIFRPCLRASHSPQHHVPILANPPESTSTTPRRAMPEPYQRSPLAISSA